MKLPIKKKYFDDIKKGKKNFEYRDAHITFICEETGEQIRKEVVFSRVDTGLQHLYPDVLTDEKTLVFQLDDGAD